MPPGLYLFLLSVCAVCVVSARKSKQDEWMHSNTMSREPGESPISDTIDIDNNQGSSWDENQAQEWPASGNDQNNDWGSAWRDDEDDSDSYEDDSSGYHALPPGIPPPPPGRRTTCHEVLETIRREGIENAFTPRCTSHGEYQAVQCDRYSTAVCWCVDKWGVEIPRTRQYDLRKDVCDRYDRESEVYTPDRDRGQGNTPPVNQPESPRDRDDEIPSIDDNGIEYGPSKSPEKDVVITEMNEGMEDDMKDKDNDDPTRSKMEHSSIIGTPGLLPGIIGGAVVGLLCAVLLVMFIVYRMRKKDEGSYALEEPKMTSPSRGYTRAPTKEYWA